MPKNTGHSLDGGDGDRILEEHGREVGAENMNTINPVHSAAGPCGVAAPSVDATKGGVRVRRLDPSALIDVAEDTMRYTCNLDPKVPSERLEKMVEAIRDPSHCR